MSATTGIQWTDATWNAITGCEQVSPGCAHCYAKVEHDRRHKASLAGKQVAAQYARPFEIVQLHDDRLDAPLRRRAPTKYFVTSGADPFHDDVPKWFLAQLFAVMALAERHTFQLLTKRPARMQALLSESGFWDAVLEAAEDLYPLTGWTADEGKSYEAWVAWLNESDVITLPNVWLGVSVENQRFADERIPLLLQTPAAVRFLSCEPLLGPVDLFAWLTEPASASFRYLSRWYTKDAFDPTGSQPERTWMMREKSPIDWVIVGGESGKAARAMHPDWARSLREQCKAAKVAYFFKQHGEYREYDVGAFEHAQRVYTGTGEADTLAERATNPAWLDIRGNLYSDPDNLPVETPCRLLERIGTKKAGRVLDGRTWDEFPAVAE